MLQHAALSSHPTHATDAAAPPSGPLDCMREGTRSQADWTRRTWDGQRDEAYCSPAQLPLCTMDSSRPQFSLKCYLTYLDQRTKRPKGPPAKHPLLWSTGFRPTITGSSSPSKSEDEGKKGSPSLPPPPADASPECELFNPPAPKSPLHLRYCSVVGPADGGGWTRVWVLRFPAHPSLPSKLQSQGTTQAADCHFTRCSDSPAHPTQSEHSRGPRLPRTWYSSSPVGQERKKEAGRLDERRKPQVCAHRRR